MSRPASHWTNQPWSQLHNHTMPTFHDNGIRSQMKPVEDLDAFVEEQPVSRTASNAQQSRWKRRQQRVDLWWTTQNQDL